MFRRVVEVKNAVVAVVVFIVVVVVVTNVIVVDAIDTSDAVVDVAVAVVVDCDVMLVLSKSRRGAEQETSCWQWLKV